MIDEVRFSINSVKRDVNSLYNRRQVVCVREEPNLVQRRQFGFFNQSQAREVRRQYHEILTARA